MRQIITFNNKNWELPEPWVPDDRFRLEALENGSVFELAIKSPYYSVLQYSLDGTTWNNLTTSTSETLNVGEKVYIRGKQSGNIIDGSNANKFLLTTGSFAVKGNIMHLYDYEHPDATSITYNYAFRALFNGCTALVDASKLLLPATTMGLGSYFAMFGGCSLLAASPELPATTLSNQCYQSMFLNCISLQEAPILPAKILVNNCYATMFDGCTSLKKVISYAENISASQCLNLWLRNVSSRGDFYNLGGANYQRSTSGIPSSWTVHTSL